MELYVLDLLLVFIFKRKMTDKFNEKFPLEVPDG